LTVSIEYHTIPLCTDALLSGDAYDAIQEKKERYLSKKGQRIILHHKLKHIKPLPYFATKQTNLIQSFETLVWLENVRISCDGFLSNLRPLSPYDGNPTFSANSAPI